MTGVLTALVFGLAAMPSATAALKLWYKFDESSGTTAADSSTSASGTHDGKLATYGTDGSAAASGAAVWDRTAAARPSASHMIKSERRRTVWAITITSV